jgi:hypothetical protein
MSLIDNRVNLRRRRCEELRQYLAELELLAERLRADAGRLRAAIEGAFAAGDMAAVAPLRERHSKVERSVAAVEGQIGAAGVALAAAEGELRGYEFAHATRAGGMVLPERHQVRGGQRGRSATPLIAAPHRKR